MTSVQNRLLRLSGSKLAYFLLLFAVLLLTQCTGGKEVTIDNGKDRELDPIYGTTEPKEGEEKIEFIEGVDTIRWDEKEPVYSSGPDKEELPVGEVSVEMSNEFVVPGDRVAVKSYYNVVVMLPFFTNKFSGGFSDIHGNSKLALEFYEGAKIALNQLQSSGVNIRVNVVDTQGDKNVVASLLQRSELLNADLIIGPVTRENATIVAEFCKQNQKTLISPLNRGDNIAQKNPYYIQVNPSEEKHYETILSYIKEKFGSTSNVLVVAPTGSIGERRVDAIQKANYLANETSAIAPLRVKSFDIKDPGGNPLELRNFLTPGVKNVVLVPSSSVAFVNYVLRELNGLKRSHPSTVVGMHYWEKFEKVDYNYFENLNVHITSEFFVNKSSNDYYNFRKSYYDIYGMNPTEHATKGYDITKYFMNIMIDHGSYPQPYFANYPGDDLLHTKFIFKPRYYSDGSIYEGESILDKYENDYLNILEYRDYKFNRVN